VLARSGAFYRGGTAAAGKPALLVPFAAAADNHQKSNAEAMVNAGAATMLDEWDLAVPGKLQDALIGCSSLLRGWLRWLRRLAPRLIPAPPNGLRTGWQHLLILRSIALKRLEAVKSRGAPRFQY